MRQNLPMYGFVFYYFAVFALSSFLVQSPSKMSASSPSWQLYTYTNSAGSRPYFVYTPENYHVGAAVPLVVMLHGCSQTATDFAFGTKMNQLADQYKFIVLYPQQMNSYNQSLCWNWSDPSNQIRGDGEPAIIAGIIQTVEQSTSLWTIDTHRVYVAGFSAGAAMAVILGATYPDIFAAIGMHSGMEYQAATNAIDSVKAMDQGGPNPQQQGQAAFDAMCTNARVIPTIVYQGSNDLVVHLINGDQVTQQWMQTDQLASNGTYKTEFSNPSLTENGQVLNGYSFSVFKWNDSQGYELQEYWKINGMGHAWSGGSPSNSYTDPSGPNASLAIVQFFMNHPFSLSDPRARSQCVAR